MKKYLLLPFTLLAGIALQAQPLENPFFGPNLDKYAYYPGDDTYMLHLAQKRFEILERETGKEQEGKYGADCYGCKGQLFTEHFLILDNSRDKTVYAHRYDLKGGYLGKQNVAPALSKDLFSNSVGSSDGRYGLWEGRENNIPKSYIGTDETGKRLWYFQQKDIEAEFGPVSKDAFVIDDSGNGYFATLKPGKTDDVVSVLRYKPGSSAPEFRQLAFPKGEYRIERLGISLGENGNVLVYGNRYIPTASSADAHGFFYATVDFSGNDAPKSRYYSHKQASKMKYIAKRLDGYPDADGGFVFVSEYFLKTVGAGKDEAHVGIVKLDASGKVLHEARYPVSLGTAESLRLVNSVYFSPDRLFVAFFSPKKGDPKKNELHYVVLDAQLKPVAEETLTETTAVMMEAFNLHAKKWGNHAVLETEGFGSIYKCIRVK